MYGWRAPTDFAGTVTTRGGSTISKHRHIPKPALLEALSSPSLVVSPTQLQVRCTASQRGELRDLASIFRADILDVSQVGTRLG